jgi:SNF2 family DNA or RNA helicase
MVDWDDDHLAHYLSVADEFANWYKQQNAGDKVSNLMLLLARIGAVEAACNIPQRTPKTGKIWTGGMTSKQRAVADLVSKFTQAGDKTVVFAESPRTLEVINRELTRRRIESVMFHGELPKQSRNRDLDRLWRYGDVPNLLATFGTMQAGWDLYQGQKVILANRSWSHKEEDQAIRRLLRPQQTRDVEAWRVHLRGSIDEYQDQLVSWKANASEAGLDWGEPQPDSIPFVHLDTILGKFVEGLAKLRGMKYWDLKEQLKKAA